MSSRSIPGLTLKAKAAKASRCCSHDGHSADCMQRASSIKALSEASTSTSPSRRGGRKRSSTGAGPHDQAALWPKMGTSTGNVLSGSLRLDTRNASLAPEAGLLAGQKSSPASVTSRPDVNSIWTAWGGDGIIRKRQGPVAQLGERCTRIAEVGGSSPLRSTNERTTSDRWSEGVLSYLRACRAAAGAGLLGYSPTTLGYAHHLGYSPITLMMTRFGRWPSHSP